MPEAVAPPPLPPALAFVEVGHFVSPSAVAGAEQCLLRQVHGLTEAERLPPHPSAELGSIVHDTMNALARLGGTPTWPDAYALFNELVEVRERELAADPHTRALVPLRDQLDLGRWSGRVAYLRSWLEGGGATGVKVATPLRGTTEEHISSDADTHVVPGSEIWLRASALRLRGRVDRIVRDDDGSYRITDFKTGRIHHDDQARREYVLQLLLYGHMVKTLEPGVGVRLFLEGNVRVEVAWSSADRARLQDLLRGVLRRLPEGRPIEAELLATPGSWCRWCDVRHRCRAYLEAAPVWWAKREARPEAIPLDAWGEVTGIERGDGGDWRVQLRDPSGAHAHVEGLTPERDLERVDVGRPMWFFDVVSTERGRPRGERPSNFGERQGGQLASVFVDDRATAAEMQ